MKTPPKEYVDAWSKLFDAMYHFCKMSKKHGMPPDRALASVISIFASIAGVSSNESRETRRDLLVDSVNAALETIDQINLNKT